MLNEFMNGLEYLCEQKLTVGWDKAAGHSIEAVRPAVADMILILLIRPLAVVLRPKDLCGCLAKCLGRLSAVQWPSVQSSWETGV